MQSIYIVDVPAETVSKKGISIPTGNEEKANIDWRPGGRTSPGGLTEGVMEDIQEGDYTWSIVK